MLTASDYRVIRKKHEVEKLSVRAIARLLGRSRKTVAKALRLKTPPGYRMAKPRAKPAIDAFRPLINRWLAADSKRRRGERLTAARVFARLRDEHGYLGSEAAVRRYVARRRADDAIPLRGPTPRARTVRGFGSVPRGK